MKNFIKKWLGLDEVYYRIKSLELVRAKTFLEEAKKKFPLKSLAKISNPFSSFPGFIGFVCGYSIEKEIPYVHVSVDGKITKVFPNNLKILKGKRK